MKEHKNLTYKSCFLKLVNFLNKKCTFLKLFVKVKELYVVFLLFTCVH